MSGKKTYLTPGRHPSAQAHWVASVSISAETWAAIEHQKALGRPLTDAEKTWLYDGIELHRAFIREARDSQVSAQDVTETLTGLAEMRAPVLLLRKYERADGWTRAEIAAAMLRDGIHDGERLSKPTGAEISRYANEAVSHGIQRRKGRGDPTGLLAYLILQWWKNLGGPVCAIATKSGYASPIVVFGDAIFKSADAPSCTVDGIKRRLLKAASQMRGND